MLSKCCFTNILLSIPWLSFHKFWLRVIKLRQKIFKMKVWFPATAAAAGFKIEASQRALRRWWCKNGRNFCYPDIYRTSHDFKAWEFCSLEALKNFLEIFGAYLIQFFFGEPNIVFFFMRKKLGVEFVSRPRQNLSSGHHLLIFAKGISSFKCKQLFTMGNRFGKETKSSSKSSYPQGSEKKPFPIILGSPTQTFTSLKSFWQRTVFLLDYRQ